MSLSAAADVAEEAEEGRAVQPLSKLEVLLFLTKNVCYIT